MAKVLRVLYDFSAEEEGELSVKSGELVALVDDGTADKDGWTLVELVGGPRTGSGFIPTEYASPLPQDGSQEQQRPSGASAPSSPAQQQQQQQQQAQQQQQQAAPVQQQARQQQQDPLLDSLRSLTLAASAAGGTSPTHAGSGSSSASPHGVGRSGQPLQGQEQDGSPRGRGAGFGATTAGGYGVSPAIPGGGAPSLSADDYARMFGAHEDWYRAASLKRQETFRGLQGESMELLRSLAEAEGRSGGLLTRLTDLEALIADERMRWASRLAEDAGVAAK